jgi:phage terminase small subunit
LSVKDLRVYKLGDKLTDKQLLWIDEYIKTNDYTTATLKAGYNCKYPRAIGYENSIRFKEIIEHRKKELNEKITKRTIAELEEIQEFWTEMFKDSSTRDSDRLKASELLAKSKGGFIEKVEVKEVVTDWFIEE